MANTNNFVCPTCGRSFNEQALFAEHETQCAAAAAGKPHAKNDEERHPDREWTSVP